MGARRVLVAHDHEPPFPRRPDAFDRIAGLEPLDEPAKAVGKAVRDAVPAGPVKDALSGTWLGHALHPLLTDLPIGTWTSAVLLDWLGGERAEPAADRLIALGHRVHRAGRRDRHDGVGRLRGRPTTPSAASGSSTRPRTSARPRCSAPRSPPAGAARAARASCSRWPAPACSARAATSAATCPTRRASASTRRRSRRRRRTGRRRCASPSCPRASRATPRSAASACWWRATSGEVHAHLQPLLAPRRPARRGRAADGCVTCPLHGSIFRLADGGVVRGPAAYPQPAWEVRVRDGVIELKAPRS